MDDTVSVTTSCLAIGDKRPRRTGGCVGIFFQLFDWNRRFSKKKLFSKRLLPPDRAKESSKPLQIDYVNNECFPNNNGCSTGDSSTNGGQRQTPNLVARLMGLESMPSGEFGIRRRGHTDDPDKKPAPHDFGPRKLQKTGVSERRSVTRFGGEVLQLKNVLSRSRKHHHRKLVSPVPKNNNNQPKRNGSRLIGAATRVLESGLQGRNKSRYAISYGERTRVKGENVGSCKNCGNLINVAGPSVLNSPFAQEQELQPRNVVSRAYLKGSNRRVDDVRPSFQSKDFVALNRSVTGQTRSRVPGKVENGPSQWQKRRITRNGPQIGSEARKPNYQGQNGNKKSDGMAFRFSSQMKNRCEVPARLERRKNNQNATSCNPRDQKPGLQSPFALTGDCLGALVEEKLQELTSRVGYDSRINGNQTTRTPAIVFQDLLCALSAERHITRNNMEFRPKRNRLCHHSGCRDDHNTRFCLQTKLQKAVGLIARRNNDHLSPGSVLEASFSNESCCSSSLEDNSGRAPHTCSMTYSYDESQESETNPFYSDVLFRKNNTCNELVLDLLTYISQVLSAIDIVHSRINGNTRAHIKRVIFNSELVLSNQMPRNPNELNSFFICDLLLDLDALADVMWTTFGNFLGSQSAVAGYQLKRFVFDAVIEYLESKYVQYSKCGFRSWINLPLFTGFDGLVHEVVEEVKGWMGLVGVTLDDLVEGDMRHCLGEWTDFEVEVYETGAIIESDILQMLVDEIVVDV